MANNKSPFEDFFVDILFNIKDNFRKHDKYLNVALVLAITPLPFLGIIALIISLLGFYLNSKNKFEIDEKSRLLTIAILASLNIAFTLAVASNTFNLYNYVFEYFYGIIVSINSYFFTLFNLSPNFIRVYVSGNVKEVGEIIIPQGSSLVQALARAGGKEILSGDIEFIRFDKYSSKLISLFAKSSLIFNLTSN